MTWTLRLLAMLLGSVALLEACAGRSKQGESAFAPGSGSRAQLSALEGDGLVGHGICGAETAVESRPACARERARVDLALLVAARIRAVQEQRCVYASLRLPSSDALERRDVARCELTTSSRSETLVALTGTRVSENCDEVRCRASMSIPLGALRAKIALDHANAGESVRALLARSRGHVPTGVALRTLTQAEAQLPRLLALEGACAAFATPCATGISLAGEIGLERERVLAGLAVCFEGAPDDTDWLGDALRVLAEAGVRRLHAEGCRPTTTRVRVSSLRLEEARPSTDISEAWVAEGQAVLEFREPRGERHEPPVVAARGVGRTPGEALREVIVSLRRGIARTVASQLLGSEP